jgi:hypothetical protein
VRLRRRRQGLNEQEIRELQASLPVTDKTADDLDAPSHFGTIEQLEERYGPPWLRERRRRQRMARGE